MMSGLSELDPMQFWLLENVGQGPEMGFAAAHLEDLPEIGE